MRMGSVRIGHLVGLGELENQLLVFEKAYIGR